MAVGSELPIYLAQLIQTVHKIEELFPMSYDSVKVEMVPHSSAPCIPPKCYPSYKTCGEAEPGSHTCPHGYQFSECCPQGLHDMYDVAPSLLPWIPQLSCDGAKNINPWLKAPISPAPALIPKVEQFIARLGVDLILEVPRLPGESKPQPYTNTRPDHEKIHTFPIEYFKTSEDYYAVLLHELGHWSVKLSKRDTTNPMFMSLMGSNPEEFIAENICIKLFKYFNLAPRPYWCGRLAIYEQDTSLVRMKTQLYEYVEQATEVLLRYPDTPTYIVTREGKRI